jgi:hypothetical protein
MPCSAIVRNVDVAIAIMIDISGSIDQIELATQSQGWADALTELANEGLFSSGPYGASLIYVGFWSEIPTDPSLARPSTLVDSPDDIIPIANLIRGWNQTWGLTNPAVAILNGAGAVRKPEFFDFHSSRKIVLLSGDGVSNVGPDYGFVDTAAARDLSIANGVDQINGLYILGDPSETPEELRRFYVNEVAGGVGGFATSVQTGHTDLHKFKEAIKGNLGFSLAPSVYLPPNDIIYPTAGDFDGDGDVDGRDFLTWQRNPGIGDLADWQNNYGAGSLGAVTAVPEPGALWLAVGCLLAHGVRRGQSRRVRLGGTLRIYPGTSMTPPLAPPRSTGEGDLGRR